MSEPYGNYDVLSQADHWDERTRGVILDRIGANAPRAFFSAEELRLVEALADRILPQPERDASLSIPVAELIDAALAADGTDGFRHDDAPWEQDAWHIGLAGIAQLAEERFGRPLWEVDATQQDALLTALDDGSAEGEAWETLPPQTFFATVVSQIVSAYYSHPTAWSEIGWGGPANPRGYVRTGYDRRDPWEPVERTPNSSVDIVRRHTEEGGPGGTHGGVH